MLWFKIIKICETIKENSYSKHLYNKHTSGNPIYWDYKTQNFYYVTGNKINTIEDEEEQD